MVRRVDLAEAVGALEVRLPGETLVVVLGVARGVRGVGIVTSEARRASWGTRLPAGTHRGRGSDGTRIEGGRIVGVTERGVEIEKDGARRTLAVGPARVALREEGLDGAVDEDARDAFAARGVELLAALGEEARERRREIVARAIKRGVQRIERRILAMRGDLARLADAEALAAQAQWLIAAAVRAPRGARSLKVTDWSSGEAREIEVPLDPSKPARVQVEAMFQRARRLKRGAKIAEERIAKADAVREGLARAVEACAAAEDAAGIEAALVAARAIAPKDVAVEAAPGVSGAAKQPKSAPFRTFVTAGGARILVGKGAAHNDKLTFQTAKPHDLWLHAKGHAGAHVVVPLAKNTTCPGELLVDAAHLAAHFSQARGETIVDITYAPRRYVRKPRGSAPGLVVVDREKVLAVRLEPGRVERLLEAEE